jgi:Ca2+-binding RTX toxin-like protein
MSLTSTLPSLSFENAGVAKLEAGVATLGQVFLKGEVPSGGGLTALMNGVSVAVQLDVKTRYDDGSVKMAVLSVERPALYAGQSVAVELVAAPAPAAPALDLGQALVGHSFVAAMSVAGGTTYHVDVLAELAKALSAGTASFWQQGELASQARVEVMLAGSQRMLFDVTAFKGGGFSVDAQFNNDRAMEAQGGTVSFNLAVTMNGRTVMQESVTQAQYQNIQRSFSSTDRDGGQGTGSPQAGWLNIQQDIAHLQATGAVATYDLGLTIDASLLHNMAQATQSDGWGDTLSANGVTQDMYATGGRGDIGITTLGNTAWLISQDPHAAAYALGQAQAAGAVPWNMWNAQAGTWLNTDAYPRLWLDGRGGTGTAGDPASGGLTQQMSGSTGWAPDVAHQPDLSFVPFLLTGERWMLDNLQAQAAWNVMIAWPAVRHDAADLLVNEGQVRGSAWALRQLDEAAWISPDGSPAQAYFQAVSHENWAWLVSKIPEWTAMQGEAHGWLPGAYGIDGALAPWQQDYFASTTIAAARHGNADALTFLKWQENFLVGRFLAADEGFNPRDGMAYLLASDDPATGRIYTTWEEIGARTIARGWSNGEGWDRTSDGNYAQLGLATLAGIWEVTGSPQARLAYEALLALNPPHTSAATFARDPNYALAAPGSTIPGDPTDLGIHPDILVPLTIKLGADSWQGDPIAIVKVDGVEVFQGPVSAAHATGGQLVELGMVSASKLHQISVEFPNDAWGGTAATDRNLYVEAILVNGHDIGQSQAMERPGTVTFSVDPAKYVVAAPVQASPPPPPPSYLGDDNIVLTAATQLLAVDLLSGNDTLTLADGGNAGTVANVEHLIGGTGNDLVTLLAPPAGMLIDLKGGVNEIRIADGGSSLQLLNVQTIKGGAGGDAITLKAAMMGLTMDGGAGIDRLKLADGANRVSLANVETITGGTGNDDVTLTAAAVDASIDLGLGNDSLTLGAGGNLVRVANVETITGGAGNDVVKLQAAQAGFTVNLSAGLDELWLANGGNTGTVFNVEKIVGGADADRITLGTTWTTGSLDLGDGLDRLTLSSAGANTITVSNTEMVTGGSQADTVTLGTAVLYGTFDLGGGNDTLVLVAGTNSVTTIKVETVKGNSGADTITAFDSTPARLEGGGGADVLRGGAGNDVIYGGTGKDIMSGGAGADRFLFTSVNESSTGNPDVISDFDATMDLIAFEGVAHNGLAWRGASVFQKNGVTQARFEERSGLLSMDFDGNGKVDFALTLTGVKLADLSASDFIWG